MTSQPRSIDFDPVAHWYDLFVRTSLDCDFWVEEAGRFAGPKLELMCGTGRLSLPVLRAGIALTCADYSLGQLEQFARKLRAETLAADLVCADARALPFERTFDAVFIGFQSFAELASEEDQRAGLASIGRALRPGGRLVLSLHNPAVRAPQLDGVWKDFGAVPIPGSSQRLHVSARFAYDATCQLASGVQRYRVLEQDGAVSQEHDLPVRFRLLTAEQFERLALQQGLQVERWWGDYQRSPLDPATSPFLIAEVRLRP
ncbi:MAG: class I SAM-dependent methyltransferase [Myxococcales bacterium]